MADHAHITGRAHFAAHSNDPQRRRLEQGLNRLGELYDQMAFRQALLSTGLGRLEGLRATMVHQLDVLTPDADLEPQGDDELTGDEEPSLGSSVPRPQDDQRHWLQGCRDSDLEADPSDAEPSLGATNPGQYTDQRDWTSGCRDSDVEGEHDGREPDVDEEHELGWTEGEGRGQTKDWSAPSSGEQLLAGSEAIDQRAWVHPQPNQLRCEDREDQCEDEGGACEDEGYDTDAEGVGAVAYRDAARPPGGPPERQAVIDKLVDEFDLLALGRPSPAVITRALAAAGFA